MLVRMMGLEPGDVMQGKAKSLTPRGILALRKEGYHRDGASRGLYVQVAWRERNGKRSPDYGVTRSWIFRFTSPITNKVRNMGLGPCDGVTLAEARDLAKFARKLVTGGDDPIEYRKAIEASKREAYLKEQASKMTFSACAEAYLAGRLDKFRHPKSRHQWRSSLELASKHFGELNVAEIDTPAVVKFLEPLWRQAPETANRTRSRIEQVLDWARVHQFRDGGNPATWKGHLQHVFAREEGGNFAAMPFAELPDFMERLHQRKSASAKALEFLILTAARSGEVRGATWNEIDLERALWTVPAERMKAKKTHEVPLSEQAIALLKVTPRIGDYIFTGGIEGKPLSDQALMQVLRGLDAGNYNTIHGFRSSFRDWAGELGHWDRETIEFSLAHKLPDRVEAAYRRGTALKKRVALMQAWANFCDGRENLGEKIVPLHA